MIGMGFVGGTTAKVLETVHKIFPYDRYKEPYTENCRIDEIAKNCEVVFICVPTPMKPSGEIDYDPIRFSLDLLYSAVKKIEKDPKKIFVVVRSTAVSGTTDAFSKDYPFRFMFNPEFLREKHALEDMKNTERIVVGVEDEESAQKIKEVYELIFPNARFIVTNRRTAEMIKYAANAALAAQIMIANEIYKICEALDIDYEIVKNTIQLDNRIGKNFDVPGPDGDFGFGGKCFPKDLNALIYLARENHVRPYFFEEVWRSNLEVRRNKDWLDIAGAISSNTNFVKT